ncbi:MAG: hypothetical protein WCA35_03330 [Kovacikia sp.]
MTPEERQEVIRLRNLKLSPKQIARKLGLRPSQVTDVMINPIALLPHSETR